MTKEDIWRKERLGMITASELGEITSARGGIIDTNLSYIRRKRWERLHGYALPVSSRQMEIGNEQEQYAFMWARENLLPDLVYSKDFEKWPFWKADDCPLGASPDSFTPDEETVVEFKTLVGNTATEFFGDVHTSYEEKKAAVWKDHGDQLLGQFISNKKVKQIYLVKYIYCNDEIPDDTDSPLAPWRGIVFGFGRDEYAESIEEMKSRVWLIDAMIKSDRNPSDFKKGEWYVEDGILKKRDK